ncbi:uncharacterized protein LOC108622529 [Ceratina calcarata]|uniref:Uncharacterized protein LOC108622529 n=1 Tax=Ceratina calcarata TaxID=156304 RepID=A0AAJ7IT09_9HYME|nr:uncharacterized protein LOC108622529 [Ceratina calcarata]XP_017875946.1 uncharacterized protein LOC108622529 [Ceratina calcarata]XP_026667350.1 uncharacterized protein LOC108622529 [Ceratina calcarata]XP_026667351.1 uncharacterized protein LOC108622529 [Ceratina calcarata]XP_026667352.1 uncharacterized protein LOC108622529 [Ceratina calcarata]
MHARAILLIILAGLANGQLNFEGNPLTENTEYTAEESRSYERTARYEATATNVTYAPEYSWSHQPLPSNTKNTSEFLPAIEETKEQRSSLGEQPGSWHITATAYNQASSNVDQTEVALNSFLNSKTPEESRLSLDHYLQSQYPQKTYATDVSQQQLLTQPSLVHQQALSSPVNRHLTTQLIQQRQGFAVNQPVYNAPANPNLMPPISNDQPMPPYAFGMQARNDVFYPEWYHRVRKVRGKPFPYAQSRGGPGFYNGPPPPGLFKPKGPPVEVIYTKPPGFHKGPAAISNPPVPYEDASAWFPEADHPPPPKDVYYSQLYAQSYDPYYYNYIAKTGKIKPYLYGKLGKHPEEDDGIWAELYRGFKKHGLKNLMTPTFLLGMTLPVVTLMLSALVQKRSLARSDSRGFSKEDAIQEYLEQVQKAIECHERKNRRRRDTNGC